MSPIVEIPGSDWDWLRLIVASGTVQCVWWKVERETLKNQTAGAVGLLPAYSSGP